MIIRKLIGWACIILGGLIMFVMPISGKNQPEEMSKAGIVFAIILMGIGLLLIKL